MVRRIISFRIAECLETFPKYCREKETACLVCSEEDIVLTFFKFNQIERILKVRERPKGGGGERERGKGPRRGKVFKFIVKLVQCVSAVDRFSFTILRSCLGVLLRIGMIPDLCLWAAAKVHSFPTRKTVSEKG